jgi:hypothetical protein
MKRIGGFQFVAGVVVGAVVFGGTVYGAPTKSQDFVGKGVATERASLAVYGEARLSEVRYDVAAGIMAQPKTAAVVIDGQEVDLQGYLINGSHYFQLRDTSAALKAGGKDFSIVWDGAGGRVLIDTSKDYDPNGQMPATDGQPPAQPAPAPATGGYGTAPKILKPGDAVKTANGDYPVKAGQLERQTELAGHGLAFGRPLAPDAPLPAWQSAWDSYPRVNIPNIAPVRFTGDIIIGGQKAGTRDSLEVFNPYETERMIRTVYRYAKNNPALWQNRDPSANVPHFTVVVERTEGLGFYPWENAAVPGEAAVKSKVESGAFGGVFRIYAYDDYENGKYTDTVYLMN